MIDTKNKPNESLSRNVHSCPWVYKESSCLIHGEKSHSKWDESHFASTKASHDWSMTCFWHTPANPDL